MEGERITESKAGIFLVGNASPNYSQRTSMLQRATAVSAVVEQEAAWRKSTHAWFYGNLRSGLHAAKKVATVAASAGGIHIPPGY
jgi:hypothetical protein